MLIQKVHLVSYPGGSGYVTTYHSDNVPRINKKYAKDLWSYARVYKVLQKYAKINIPPSKVTGTIPTHIKWNLQGYARIYRDMQEFTERY